MPMDVPMPVHEELSLHTGVCNNHVGVDRLGRWQSHVKMAETYLPLLNDVLQPDLSDLVLGFLLVDYSVELAENSRSETPHNNLFEAERYVVAAEALDVVRGVYNLRRENYPFYVKKMDPIPPGIFGWEGDREYIRLIQYMFCGENQGSSYRRDRRFRGDDSSRFRLLMDDVVGYEHHHPSRMSVMNLWMDHFQGVFENELSPPYFEMNPQYGRIYVLQQVRVPWYVQTNQQM
jgi:hypothetical protein